MEESEQRISIGAVVRAWRIYRGMSEDELSRRTSLGRRYITDLEENKVFRPILRRQVSLANAFAIPHHFVRSRILPPTLTLKSPAVWEEIEKIFERAQFTDEERSMLNQLMLDYANFIAQRFGRKR